MKKSLTLLLILFMAVLFLSSCQSVRPYQRVYLNDHFMKMDKKHAKAFREKALTYREGSAGGGTGKGSGGCGCN